MTVERIRSQFRPRRVRVLLVGESAPRSGRCFYFGNTRLAQATSDACELAFDQDYLSTADFLGDLKRRGVYLVDLCLQPVNGLAHGPRRRARHKGIPKLARTMSEIQPGRVVVVMKAIAPQVVEAVEASGIAARMDFPPFPLWHRREYVSRLAEILRDEAR